MIICYDNNGEYDICTSAINEYRVRFFIHQVIVLIQ